MAKNTLQIFRTGRHTPTQGSALNFSEADLEASANAYNPALHEAPIVVGHPKQDGPAFGWIQSLAFADGALEAEPAQVDPEFREAVDAGRYKKISASFYAKDSPHNPVPGVYYLRHVGFLGAEPPSIKGLRNVSFSESEDGVIEFAELTSWDVRSLAKAMRGLRDWVAGKFTLEDADRAIPSYLVEDLEAAANRPKPEASATTAGTPAFSESKEDPMTNPPGGKPGAQTAQAPATTTAPATPDPAALAAKEADLANREAALNAREAEATKKEDQRIRDENAEFAETLTKAGRLATGDKPAVVELLTMAAKAAPLEFGEGDKKTQVELGATLRRILESRPKLLEFGERAGGDGPASPAAEDPKAVAARVVEFQEKEAQAGRTVSTTQAYEAVMKGGK